MEEEGVRKPSVNERLMVAHTRAYEAGNIEGVRVAEGHIAKREGAQLIARVRKKQRRNEFCELRRTLELNNRIPDPRSDGKGAVLA